MNENELSQYINDHELDHDEAEALKDWVKKGNSIRANPDDQYDDYGEEIPFMKWYWAQQDPLLPPNHKKFLNHAMKLHQHFDDLNTEYDFLESAQNILKREIILYRRFLARYPGATRAYEEYRSDCVSRTHRE
jgi:hypothetical protein